MLLAATWLETISLITNASLFLLRVLAVYADSSRKVKTGFIFAWATTFLSLTGPFSAQINFAALGCNIGQVKPLSSPGFLSLAVFDTLVFVAISIKVLRMNSDWYTPGQSYAASFIRGADLTRVSRVLLRSGQLYYLYVLPCPKLVTLLNFVLRYSY